MNITFIPSENVPKGLITYLPFGNDSEPDSIEIETIVMKNTIKVADNILQLKIMTDCLNPEHTIPKEINANGYIEYNSEDDAEIEVLKKTIESLGKTMHESPDEML